MSTFPPYQPPAPDLPLSTRFTQDADDTTALVAAVRARLDEGEILLCLLAVAKIQPALDFVGVTNHRVIAGWRGDLTNTAKNLPVVIPIEIVAGVEVSGFMDNVKFVLADGDDDRDGVKVGNLWDAADEEALRAAVRTAQSVERTGEERASVEGTSEERASDDGPPSYELY